MWRPGRNDLNYVIVVVSSEFGIKLAIVVHRVSTSLNLIETLFFNFLNHDSASGYLNLQSDSDASLRSSHKQPLLASPSYSSCNLLALRLHAHWCISDATLSKKLS